MSQNHVVSMIVDDIKANANILSIIVSDGCNKSLAETQLGNILKAIALLQNKLISIPPEQSLLD